MKFVILDRDGVINYDSDDYIKSPVEWIPIPGSLEAIARLHREGYRILIATNQSGVGRGLFNLDTLIKIQAKMIEAVRAKGGDIEAIFFCPHGPDAGCRCRKPLPGLLEQITERTNASLAGVYAVGDSERDIAAARAVQARPVLVKTGKGRKTAAKLKGQDVPIYEDLAAFADDLLSGKLPA